MATLHEIYLALRDLFPAISDITAESSLTTGPLVRTAEEYQFCHYMRKCYSHGNTDSFFVHRMFLWF